MKINSRILNNNFKSGLNYHIIKDVKNNYVHQVEYAFSENKINADFREC